MLRSAYVYTAIYAYIHTYTYTNSCIHLPVCYIGLIAGNKGIMKPSANTLFMS